MNVIMYKCNCGRYRKILHVMSGCIPHAQKDKWTVSRDELHAQAFSQSLALSTSDFIDVTLNV